MDRRYRVESVWKGDVNVLLPIKRPISNEHRICRVFQIEDHDVVPRPPLRIVASTSPDDVGDACVTFPPVLVSSREIPYDGVAACDGAHTDGLAWICDIPNLVGRVGERSEQIVLLVLNR